MEWIDIRLGGACTKIGSGATPRGGGSVYLDAGPIAFIRSQNIYNEGFSEDGIVYLDATLAQGLANVQVEDLDVLLNITGDSVARACQVKKEILPARVNQHVAIIRTDPKILWPTYVRYFLVSPAMQAHMLGLAAVGATRNALTKGMIESFSIRCPKEVDDQKAIADVLCSLDNKIAANRRINQTLEAMAQAIFKSWFVDFDPVKAKITAKQERRDPLRAAMSVISGKPDAELDALPREQYDQLVATAELFPDEMEESELGEIPKGWRAGCIGDIALARGGYAFKSSEFGGAGSRVVKIKNITGDGRVDLSDCDCVPDPQPEKLDKFKLDNGDLLIAMTGATVGKIGISVPGNECIYLNQRVAKFESKIKTSSVSWFLFPCIQQKSVFESIVGAAQGSAQPNISSSEIERTEIIIPPENLISEYCELVDPTFKKWMANNLQNIALATLRGTLLPKLLSGELSVAETASEVAA